MKRVKLLNLADKIPVRLRLSLGHALWMSIFLSLIGLGVLRFFEQNIFEVIDASLFTSAKIMREEGQHASYNSLRLKNGPFTWSIWDEFGGGRRFAVRSYPKMVDLSGNISARSSNMSVRLPVTPLALSRAEKGLVTFESFPQNSHEKAQLRMVTLPVMSNGRFTGELIHIGTPLESTYRLINQMKTILIVSMTLTLIISVVLGYLLTKAAFSPVVRITSAAKGFSAQDLGKRLSLTAADDELRALIVTFNQMLERLDDAFNRLRRFAGDVSHELRTPLAVLRGEAELALRRERSSDEYRQALRVIAGESASMTKVVEDLLLLARAQGKSIDLKWQDIQIDRLAKTIIEEVRKNFEDKSVKLDTFVDGDQVVRVGVTYLSLAIKNLLWNALKHSEPNSTVHWQVSVKNDSIFISVKDEGSGIPSKDLPYIFDAFYRADDARNRSLGGVGIGLSLVQALTRLHGGTVDVQSEEGVGSVFTITIPIGSPIDSKKRPKGIGKKSAGGSGGYRRRLLSTIAQIASKSTLKA